MKQVIATKNGETVIQKGWMQGDGCSIHIKDSVLKEAVQSGIVNDVAQGKSIDNVFYRIDDITLLRVKPEIYVIIDSCINSNEWIAKTLKNYSIHYHYSGSHKTKHTVRVSVPNVISTNRKGETIKGTKGINITYVMHELSKKNLKLGEDHKFTSLEGHHDKCCWDNRLQYTKSITHEEHKEYHKIHSQASHQVITRINNCTQLKDFIDFIHQDYKL